MTFVSHTDVGGRRRLHSAAGVPGVGHGTLAGQPAPENLLVGTPEVLRQESVDDGVDGGVAVGQAVSHHPEHEGGLVQGERAKLHPQVDNVMRQPRQTEDHHHHQDCLGCLWREGGGDGDCHVIKYNRYWAVYGGRVTQQMMA